MGLASGLVYRGATSPSITDGRSQWRAPMWSGRGRISGRDVTPQMVRMPRDRIGDRRGRSPPTVDRDMVPKPAISISAAQMNVVALKLF